MSCYSNQKALEQLSTRHLCVQGGREACTNSKPIEKYNEKYKTWKTKRGMSKMLPHFGT